jgi:hypothetical protein
MKYFVGFLVTLGLIIILIFLLFRGGGKPKAPLVHKTLDSYASTSTEMRFTIDGPVNADSQHNQVQITVSNSDVTFEQLQGYNGNVVSTQTYVNNQNSYIVFLRALTLAGFTKGSNTPALTDERGYCPLGDRYVVEVIQNDQDIEHYWATNCSGPKTYLGDINLTADLFKAQVPNYQGLVNNISL